MKKLVLGIAITLIATAYSNPKNKQAAISATADGYTLNGFTADQATNMITCFKNTFMNDVSSDVGTKSVYTTYSCAELYEIDTLLEHEKSMNPGTDGIRIYFGAEKSTLPGAGANKLKIHLFMVSTRTRISPPDPKGGEKGSVHFDYYSHTAKYLTALTQPFGDGEDDAANAAVGHGALLYDDPVKTKKLFPAGTCNEPITHYVSNIDALTWVQNRGDSQTGATSDLSGYNTQSEWFDYNYITSLFKIIANNPNKFSGLRIYLGEGRIEDNDTLKRKRDVFILIPTKKDSNQHDVDDYECMANYFKMANITKSNHAGDNGELCPFNCN